MRRLGVLLVLLFGCRTPTPADAPSNPNALAMSGDPGVEEPWLPEPTPEQIAAAEPTLEEMMAELEPIALARPPFTYTLARAVELQAGPQPQLKQRAQSKNQITDEDAWFERNGLSVPLHRAAWKRTRGQTPELPDWAPPEWRGLPLVRAIDGSEGAVLFYGNNFESEYLVVLSPDKSEPRAIFDFAAWVMPPRHIPEDARFVQMRPVWAQVQDGVLYLNHDHRTYAKSSKGSNAYVSALDVDTGELRWRSAALASNTRNFLLRGGFVLTGYGFTAEKDFLVILDQRTGKEVWRKKIVSGPDWLIEKEGVLYVRTYNTDYEFTLR